MRREVDWSQVVMDEEDVHFQKEMDWRLDKDGYVVCYIQTKIGLVRYQLANMLIDVPTGCVADHKDRNINNYKKSNLRAVTHLQNRMNSGPQKRGLGYKGVCFDSYAHHPNVYKASIRINGKSKHLGVFSTAELAARAYDKKAFQIYGEHAFLNFPDALSGV